MTRNAGIPQKGLAMSLAAIMILSVVGASIAFSGAVTAVKPDTVSENNLPGVVYPGQVFDVKVANPADNWGDTAYLAKIERDGSGDIDSFSLVRSLEDNTAANDQRVYRLNTIDTDSGNEYAIANTSSYRTSTEVVSFYSIDESFDATFDADRINNTDQRSSIKLDSDRQTSSYNISVQADGLSYDQLKDLFNVSGATGNDAEIRDSRYLPLNGTFEADYDDGDDITDLEDEGVLTLNLTALQQDSRLSNDKLGIYPKNLAENAGLPGDAEYEFEFVVTDTTSRATDVLSISSGKTIPPVYNFQIPNDGDVYTVGFPAPLNGTVSEALNESNQNLGSETTVYVYENGGWVSKNTANIEPEALDAIVIVTDGDDGEDVINMEMRFETTNTPNPGDIAVSEGWNFVAAPSYDPADQVFNVGQTREVFNPFNDPPSNQVRAAESFLNYRMSSSSTPEVSPFTGYFIYTEKSDAIQTGLAGGVVDLPQSDEYLN